MGLIRISIFCPQAVNDSFLASGGKIVPLDGKFDLTAVPSESQDLAIFFFYL